MMTLPKMKLFPLRIMMNKSKVNRRKVKLNHKRRRKSQRIKVKKNRKKETIIRKIKNKTGNRVSLKMKGDWMIQYEPN